MISYLKTMQHSSSEFYCRSISPKGQFVVYIHVKTLCDWLEI